MHALPELRAVREELESVLSQSVASRVMFEAIGEHPVPQTTDEVASWVRGPLGLRLVAQLGADSAGEMITRLDRLLDRRKRTGSFYDLDIEVEDDDPARAPTRAMAFAVDDPVPVLVVSASSHLAFLLQIALGEEHATVIPVADASAIRKASFAARPLVALVHGEEPPPDAQPAAAAIADMPESVLCVLWAADAFDAEPMASALATHGRHVLAISRADGLDPFFDLVRSRRRATERPPASPTSEG